MLSKEQSTPNGHRAGSKRLSYANGAGRFDNIFAAIMLMDAPYLLETIDRVERCAQNQSIFRAEMDLPLLAPDQLTLNANEVLLSLLGWLCRSSKLLLSDWLTRMSLTKAT